MNWPEEPKDVGDCYLLCGYPDLSEGSATLAFAMHTDDPSNPDRFAWALIADDGDIYLWGDAIPADEIIFVRSVREGLMEHIPPRWKEAVR